VFMQLTRDLFAIAKFLLICVPDKQAEPKRVGVGNNDSISITSTALDLSPVSTTRIDGPS